MEPGPLLLEAFEAGRGDAHPDGEKARNKEGRGLEEVPDGPGGGDIERDIGTKARSIGEKDEGREDEGLDEGEE
ncbi:MAG: hypothetical protein METHAR1v1_1590004 [Methanothrix sp.]|nr:MAG: hypothetical protein METHAR1v1_1590004 [Methanothrix sp.]